MGQQQLLLLVFAVVIVGFAVIAGITAAEEKFRQSVADTLVEHNLTIASDAVFWKTKSDPFSGGNARYTGLGTNGLAKLSLSETTVEGRFQITRATDTELEITAQSIRYPLIGARTLVRDYEIISTTVAFDGSIVIQETN